MAGPLAVAAMLALTAGAAAFSTLQLGEVESQLAPPTTPEPEAVYAPEPVGPPPERSEPPSTGLSWLGDVVVAAALVAAVAGLVLLVRALARWRGGRAAAPRLRRLRAADSAAGAATPAEQTAEAPLLDALDAGLADLSDDDRDPRRAVIACWVRLAETAAAAGVPRHHTDTAGDLVVRLLRTHQVSEQVLARFAEVYRLARYATHTVDERMRTDARSSLRQLREELACAPAPAFASAPVSTGESL